MTARRPCAAMLPGPPNAICPNIVRPRMPAPPSSSMGRRPDGRQDVGLHQRRDGHRAGEPVGPLRRLRCGRPLPGGGRGRHMRGARLRLRWGLRRARVRRERAGEHGHAGDRQPPLRPVVGADLVGVPHLAGGDPLQDHGHGVRSARSPRCVPQIPLDHAWAQIGRALARVVKANQRRCDSLLTTGLPVSADVDAAIGHGVALGQSRDRVEQIGRAGA